MMMKPDGSKATSVEENTKVFTDHLKKLLQRVPQVDKAVLDEVPQQPYHVDVGRVPTVDEIDAAVRQLNFSGSGYDGIAAHMWKAIARDNDLFFDYVVTRVQSFWKSEVLPEGWKIAEASMLPKKGNLSLPGNWRSIMKIVIPQKVVLNLIRSQLEAVCESLPHEEQCGFRKLRGCIDAIFNVRLGLKKRQEHSLETVAFFVDFVKAFDRVPREMLWKVLDKLGVPPKMVRLVAVLHSKVTVRLEGSDITSTNGVRQGCVLGPILFLFYACAMNISWAAKRTSPSCKFLSSDEVLAGHMHGKKGSKGTEFTFDRSTHADDLGENLQNRTGAVIDLPAQVGHYARFDVEAHSKPFGSDDATVSKSVCMLLSKNPSQHDDYEKGKFKWIDKMVKSTGQTKKVKRFVKYSQHRNFNGADQSPIDVDDLGSTVHFAKHFACLGSVLDQMLSNLPDVEARIAKALAVFGETTHFVRLSPHYHRDESESVQCFRHGHGTVRMRELVGHGRHGPASTFFPSSEDHFEARHYSIPTPSFGTAGYNVLRTGSAAAAFGKSDADACS
jgi:hypothetical protein